jgi:uncharacterized protein YecT (DUF1311 family)
MSQSQAGKPLEAIAAEIRKHDARMKEAYTALMKSFAETELTARIASLRETQDLWVRFRDANCKYYALEFGRGALGPVMAASCNLRMTAERADELEDEMRRQMD